jgi:23S rRNA pseudouridine1911/1915/1917 synthase
MTNCGEERSIVVVVPFQDAGHRLDVYVARTCTELSRNRISKLIRDGFILVDGETKKSHYQLKPHQEVSIRIPLPAPVEVKPESLPLDVIYEDPYILVVNKPAGMVVHPGAGNASGTLVNALLAHCSDLSGNGEGLRPGIVHRLDKETSGLLVIAKNDRIHEHLSRALKLRQIHKTYIAICVGLSRDRDFSISLPIGRQSKDRKLRAVVAEGGREAITVCHMVRCYQKTGISVFKIYLETGRTHQIRVHMAHMGYPVLGDKQYGQRRQKSHLKNLKVSRLAMPVRHMLHAARIQFFHPIFNKMVSFKAPLPQDMRETIKLLHEIEKGIAIT